MPPQITCLRECIVVMVAFVRLFSAVLFQMNVQIQPESMHSHTGCNYLTLLHCALSNASSNCLPERIYKHNGCICSTFLHCAFSNASSNCLPERMQSHTGCICLIKSSPDQIRMLQPITILSLITLSLSWIQDYQD